MLKARFIARGFEQRKGVDFEETFAPIIKQEMEKIVVGLASQYGWQMEHLDIKAIVVFCDNQTSW